MRVILRGLLVAGCGRDGGNLSQGLGLKKMKATEENKVFELFIDQYRGYMIHRIWRVMRDVNLLDDILQQSFVADVG